MYNVMIVDDELWFRSYLKELIDQSGSEFLVCAQAANGAEALKILAAQPVDVVIADVLMPVMDGVELMQHLSDLPHRLPVLAPLVFLVRRVPLCSRGLFYIHDLAELSEPETVRCLTPCSPASGELAGFVRAHGAGVLNVCFQNAFAVLEAWQRPKRTGRD